MRTWRFTHPRLHPAGAEETSLRLPVPKPRAQVGLAALLALLFLPACQRLPARKEMVPPQTIGGAALHAVHSDRLKGIMAGLNALAFERLPQELDTASRQRAELRKAAAVADELARSAEQIPGVADDLNLAPEDRKVFLALAQQLQAQVRKVNTQASRNELRAVEATMRDMSGTCIACHSLFRQNSPEVDTLKP